MFTFKLMFKLGTMDISSKTGVITLIYKKGDKEDIADYKLILNLGYKIYTIIPKNCM